MKSLLTLLCVLAMSGTVQAKTVSLIEVQDARIFMPLQGSNATAGYGVMKNISKKDVTVTITSAAPFKAVELHETKEKDGRMAMQKVETLTLKPNETLDMKPGGHHIMLFDATEAVKKDQVIQVKFTVNKQEQSVPFKVIPRAEQQHEHHH